MKLTTKGRYAVMALTALASRNAVSPVPLADIAERQDISLSYLEQIFARLRRGGLVTSVRGPGGGYMIARRADHIVVADIVRAVEEDGGESARGPLVQEPRLTRNRFGRESACPTKALWHALDAEVEAFLDGITLADVIEGRLHVPGGARREMTSVPE
ncbi:Rrf2 family transcriptional regulator [Marivibrio halodurans]|uniref:Rrf2 family transcriptional regulator n=1 Tax=Marivibrio halodurans TaxID=2039722 RepID=A0A8J7S1M3_9PROT|nr:Rrf2 family transcriptional regulator [Marivibrio halodurans]MBP5857024.1 Rrf2 family transcriptional regulator [Marivibrio halodurans]